MTKKLNPQTAQSNKFQFWIKFHHHNASSNIYLISDRANPLIAAHGTRKTRSLLGPRAERVFDYINRGERTNILAGPYTRRAWKTARVTKFSKFKTRFACRRSRSFPVHPCERFPNQLTQILILMCVCYERNENVNSAQNAHTIMCVRLSVQRASLKIPMIYVCVCV